MKTLGNLFWRIVRPPVRAAYEFGAADQRERLAAVADPVFFRRVACQLELDDSVPPDVTRRLRKFADLLDGAS